MLPTSLIRREAVAETAECGDWQMCLPG
jgi:hypothetical protein